MDDHAELLRQAADFAEERGEIGMASALREHAEQYELLIRHVRNLIDEVYTDASRGRPEIGSLAVLYLIESIIDPSPETPAN